MAERDPETRLDPEDVVDKKKTAPSLLLRFLKSGTSELNATHAQMTNNHFIMKF
jgi:hypothetical protein